MTDNIGEITLICDDSIKNGEIDIEKVKPWLDKAMTAISNAQSALDKDISVSGFAEATGCLTTSISNFENIIHLCDDFVEHAQSDFDYITSRILNPGSNISTENTLTIEQASNQSKIENVDTNKRTNSQSDNRNDTLTKAEYVELLSMVSDKSKEELEKEYDMLLLYSSYQSETEMEMDDIYSIIDNDDLSQEDKEYINGQLEKGNVRAAMQYIIVKITEKEVESLQDEKKKIQNRLNEINATGDPTRTTIPAQNTEEVKELNKRLSEIKEIEKKLNQYKLANKEWEYDCYFKKREEEEFQKTIVPYLFFSLATNYYKQNDNEDYLLSIDLISKVLYDGSFLSWLKSDECNISNKDELIEYYNTYLDGKDENMVLMEYDDSLISGFTNYLGIGENSYNLTEEEKEVLAYIYLTEGEEAAQEFINTFKQTMNMRDGIEMALQIFNNIVTASNNGVGVLGAGWEGIKLGTSEWFAKIAEIMNKDGIMTAEEYAALYINNLLCSASYLSEISKEGLEKLGIDDNTISVLLERVNNGEKITYLDVLYINGQIDEETYNSLKELEDDPNINEFIKRNQTQGAVGLTHMEWLNYAFNAGIATGNMLPSIALSIMTNNILGAVGTTKDVAEKLGKLMAALGMSTYAYSANKSESIREGYDYGVSVIYSLLAAAGESITEYFIGGVPFISKGVDWLKINPTDSATKQIIKALLSWIIVDPLLEITQEELQDIVWNPLMMVLAGGDVNFNASLEQMLQTAIVTYLSTFTLQGAASMVNVFMPLSFNALTTLKDLIIIKINNMEYELSFSDLLSCRDENTGKLSREKLMALLEEKHQNMTNDVTGVDSNVSFNNERITYNINGKEGNIDYNTLQEYLKNNELSFNNIDNEAINGLTQGELVNILLQMNNSFDGAVIVSELIGEDARALLIKLNEYAIADENLREAMNLQYTKLPELMYRIAALAPNGREIVTTLLNKIVLIGSEEEWKRLIGEKNVEEYSAGFHVQITGISYILIDSDLAWTLHTMVHEIMHGLGTIVNSTDTTDYTQLNEAMTDYFTIQTTKSGFMRKSGYCYGVILFHMLLEAQIPGLRTADFMDAYYKTHDLTSVKEAMDSLMGEGYFDNVFIQIFNPITEEEIIRAKKIIDDIIAKSQNNDTIILEDDLAKLNDNDEIHVTNEVKNEKEALALIDFVDFMKKVAKMTFMTMSNLLAGGLSNVPIGSDSDLNINSISSIENYMKNNNLQTIEDFMIWSGLDIVPTVLLTQNGFNARNQVHFDQATGNFYIIYDGNNVIVPIDYINDSENNANLRYVNVKTRNGKDVVLDLSSGNVCSFVNINEINNYMNANGLQTIEDFMKSTKRDIVPIELLRSKSLRPSVDIHYDHSTGDFYIEVDGNKVIIHSNYINNPRANTDKRLSSTNIDGRNYWVDTMTGTMFLQNITITSRDWTHILYGIYENVMPKGGHSFFDLIKYRGNGSISVDTTTDASGKTIYTYTSGDLTIVIEDIRNGVLRGSWIDTNFSQNAKWNHTFFPSSWSIGDINNAINVASNSQPVAILCDGKPWSAHIGTYKDVDVVVVKDNNGRIITVYPLFPGDTFSYNGWVKIR